MTMDRLTVTGVVVDRDHKDGTKANGDTWDKYSFQIAGATGRSWYSSFDKASWDALKKGEAFQIFYSEKENPNNSAHPFRNLEWWKEVDPEDIPAPQPQAASSPGTSGGAPVTGDERFRTKVELRWTEAWHMAAQTYASSGFFHHEAMSDEFKQDLETLSHYFYDQLAQYDITAGPPAASDSEPASEPAPGGPVADADEPPQYKASLPSLAALKDARVEHHVSQQKVGFEAYDRYGVHIDQITDKQVDDLINMIANGTITPDHQPATTDASGQPQGGE